MKLVLDVSNNAPISATQFKESGAVALICKATEGTSFKDRTLSTHRKIAAGKPFGSYLFLHPNSEGSEAAYYLDYARPKPGDIQPVIDAEVTNMGIADLARRAQSCSKALEAEGYSPLLYASAGVWGQMVALQPQLKRLRVWEAQYPSRAARWLPSLARLRWKLRGGKVVLWQFTDNYKVGGRHFDASVLLVPLDEILIPTKSKQLAANAAGGKATAI